MMTSHTKTCAPKPGHYHEVGPNGQIATNGHKAIISEGDRLPPTSTFGNRWERD